MESQSHTYIAMDLKSFYASVECVDRGLDPLNTNLVVADASRTQKTICLAVSPSLKSYGIPGRARPVSYTHLDVYKRQELCDGKLPVQRYGDFREKVTGEHPAETDGVQRSGPEALEPQCKGCLLYTSMPCIRSWERKVLPKIWKRV